MQNIQNITIVIPMAGEGSRFTQYGFKTNKYMLPINIDLESMIEKAIVTIDVDVKKYKPLYVFITRNASDHIKKHLDDICKRFDFTYELIDINHLTQGPASTVYEAKHIIPDDDQLIVSNSDQILQWNFGKFMQSAQRYDGCVLTYPLPYHADIGSLDKHSFVKLDDAGNVVDVAEKIVLSHTALVGVHYYKKASYFFEAYNDMLVQDLRAPNGEFYMSLSYKAMIQSGKRTVGIYHIDQVNEVFYPTGEPQDYFDYLRKSYVFEPQYLSREEQVVDVSCPNVVYKTFYKDEVYSMDGQYCLCILSGSLRGKILCNIPKYKFIEICTVVIITNIDIKGDAGIYDKKDFVRGWFLGGFEPSVAKVYDFEVGLLEHKKDENWDFHYHNQADEINVLLKGKMMINNVYLDNSGSTQPVKFTIPKKQIACPKFLDDCHILCIKVPYVRNDKFCL